MIEILYVLILNYLIQSFFSIARLATFYVACTFFAMASNFVR